MGADHPRIGTRTRVSLQSCLMKALRLEAENVVTRLVHEKTDASYAHENAIKQMARPAD